MTNRRPMGALEQEIMEFLWAIDEAATPAIVHEAVAPELAYTTVMTVLTRLFEKGRLTRKRQGRAYEYRALGSEAAYRADEMSSSLVDSADRVAVLSQFIDSLAPEDVETLRCLLDRNDP